MVDSPDALSVLRGARNVRRFRPDPVPPEAIDRILEIARWTGSAGNAQPWQFVVVRDRAAIEALARTGPNLPWLATAPLLIVPVMLGKNAATEGFDEGRLAERIVLAARAQGLEAGLGWFLPGPPRAEAAAILGAPGGRVVRTVVAIGFPDPSAAPTGMRAEPPRKPLADLVHHDRFGAGDSGGA